MDRGGQSRIHVAVVLPLCQFSFLGTEKVHPAMTLFDSLSVENPEKLKIVIAGTF